MISETHTMEVPFFDVDSMDIVWHGHYAKYLELARCLLLDKIGYNYRDMKLSGYAFPIVDMRIKYIKPIIFGQSISITATLAEWDFRLKINYLIEDLSSGERLTKAHTIQAAIDLKTQEMRIECPKIFIDKISRLL